MDRVLTVDDDPCMSRLMEGWIGGLGHIATTVPTIEDATRELARTDYAVVICGTVLDAEVIRFIRRVCEPPAKTGVVTLTDLTHVQEGLATLLVGAADCLVQPFNRQRFGSAVGRALERRGRNLPYDTAPSPRHLVTPAQPPPAAMAAGAPPPAAGSIAIAWRSPGMPACATREPCKRGIALVGAANDRAQATRSRLTGTF